MGVMMVLMVDVSGWGCDCRTVQGVEEMGGGSAWGCEVELCEYEIGIFRLEKWGDVIDREIVMSVCGWSEEGVHKSKKSDVMR
jgi:hypothetical protein